MSTFHVSEEVHRAFDALVAFAERNFPRDERLKGVEFLDFGTGARLVLAGGGGFEPGVYYVQKGDKERATPADIYESGRIADPATVIVTRIDEVSQGNQRCFVLAARHLVNF